MILENIDFLGFNKKDDVNSFYFIYKLDSNAIRTYGTKEPLFIAMGFPKRKIYHKVVYENRLELAMRIQKRRILGYSQLDNWSILDSLYPNLNPDLSKLIFWESMRHSA